MKVVLTQDVSGLGQRYQVVQVADGYGRNYLLPQGLALLATQANIRKAKVLKQQKTAAKQMTAALAHKSLASLAEQTFHLVAKANEAGHLFAGLDATDLAKWLETEHHLSLQPEHIKLEQPIKALGEFTIPIQVGEEKGELKLKVESAEAEPSA